MRLRDEGKFVDENGKVIGEESSSSILKETILGWRNLLLYILGRNRMERDWELINKGKKVNENRIEIESESSGTGGLIYVNTAQ